MGGGWSGVGKAGRGEMTGVGRVPLSRDGPRVLTLQPLRKPAGPRRRRGALFLCPPEGLLVFSPCPGTPVGAGDGQSTRPGPFLPGGSCEVTAATPPDTCAAPLTCAVLPLGPFPPPLGRLPLAPEAALELRSGDEGEQKGSV